MLDNILLFVLVLSAGANFIAAITIIKLVVLINTNQ